MTGIKTFGAWRPEYLKALKTLNEHLDQLSSSISGLGPDEKSVKTNALQLYSNIFSARHIPSGPRWTWNQTQAQKQALLTKNNTKVTVSKLIPRRKNRAKSREKVPSLKMWHFELVTPDDQTFIALWCEKGVDTIEKFPIDLDELSFLAEFMSPDVSSQLWPGVLVH